MLSQRNKLYRLIWGGMCYDPYVFINFIWHIFVPTKATPLTEVAYNDILHAIETGRSFIRIGDGEMLILTGRDIYFQSTAPALAEGLRSIITNYTNASPYILGVPTNKLVVPEHILVDKKQRRIWRLYRTLFPIRFPQDVAYAPLTFFYVGGRFEHDIAPLLKDRHVIFVSNADVLTDNLKTYADQHFATCSYIETPATDAFAVQAKITESITEAITKETRKPVILFAAGPASKVLSYTFIQQGVQCLDIGRGMSLINTNQDRSHKM